MALAVGPRLTWALEEEHPSKDPPRRHSMEFLSRYGSAGESGSFVIQSVDKKVSKIEAHPKIQELQQSEVVKSLYFLFSTSLQVQRRSSVSRALQNDASLMCLTDMHLKPQNIVLCVCSLLLK